MRGSDKPIVVLLLSTKKSSRACARFNLPPAKPKSKEMDNFSLAIGALVAERDRVFLLRVAQDYNLPFEELSAKYLETAEAAIKAPPRKYTKKPKSADIVVEAKQPVVKQCCTSQTSKKEPCKFSALKGEVFCKRHLKQAGVEPAPKAEKVPKVKKVEKKAEPIHTHPIDETPTEPCDMCDKYGEPLTPISSEFEVVSEPVMKTAAQRLAEMLEEVDSDSETELDIVDTEEFEDDG